VCGITFYDVVVGAAKSAVIAKLVERDAAHRTRALVELGQLFGRLADGQLMGQHARQAGRHGRLFF
jgi:hypothetical protein